MERVTGFEPVPIAWKAIVLAINTTPAQSENYNKKGSILLPIFLNLKKFIFHCVNTFSIIVKFIFDFYRI